MTHAIRRVPGRARVLLSLLAVAAIVVAVLVGMRPSDPTLRLTSDQMSIALRLVSVLMHDSETPRYEWVVHRLDERGYAAGVGDFSTAHGEALEVVQTYTARVGANPLARDYLPRLQTLATLSSPDVDSIAGYPEAWQAASMDPVFREVQDDVMQTRYVDPALGRANDLGITTPVGFVALLDALIQHGDAGPDGLPSLITRASDRAGGDPRHVSERDWMFAFLDVRADTLANPADSRHLSTWPPTVARAKVLRELADVNDQLAPPVVVNPYGTPHVLDAGPVEFSPTAPVLVASAPPLPSTAPKTDAPPPVRTSSQPPPPQIPHRVGPVVGLNGLCLDVDGGVPVDGNHVKTWTCNATAAQIWSTAADGTVRAVGKCMQTRDDSAAAGSRIEISTCDAGPSQQWRFTDGRVVNQATGLCLAVLDDAVLPGAWVVAANCGPAPGQSWQAPPEVS